MVRCHSCLVKMTRPGSCGGVGRVCADKGTQRSGSDGRRDEEGENGEEEEVLWTVDMEKEEEAIVAGSWAASSFSSGMLFFDNDSAERAPIATCDESALCHS